MIRDQRGGVLIIGLFMALGLVGALWFLIGIGDAIVFRDRGQELADSAAYSSATIHARGMNMIAAINIIMLLLVAVYVFACLLGDFLLLLAAAVALTGIGDAGPAEVLGEAGADCIEWAEGYAEAIGPVLTGLSVAQDGVALGMPWAGTASAMDVATHYDDHGQGYYGIAFGGSNIPGIVVSGGLTTKNGGGIYKSKGGEGAKDLRGADVTWGLPVGNESNASLCGRAVKESLDFFKRIHQNIPVIGWAMKLPFVNKVIDTVIDGLSWGTTLVHCNEAIPPWGWDGPKKMQSKNGEPSMQVWGVAIGGTFTDDSQRHVQMAQGPQRGFGGGQVTERPVYLAQAEFFYDCEGEWDDDDCNGGFIGWNSFKREHALYSIAWKARLRRMDDPVQSGVALILERFGNALFSDQVQKFITTNGPLAKTVEKGLEKLSKILPPIVPGGKSVGEQIYEIILKRIFDAANDESSKGVGKVFPVGAWKGVYH